ncbi:tRNA preQ1(34) S-adenosylmethionine ribosyltransferase-isomerase QueA [Alkalicella caledoniensis]|uniref:S-adenosylmethionine:tRNA ribosyltransferase-isomerase n=1 Tax=Alkalicella caledoniensis TaxID=2731377 RepID=A0A7G9WAL4_ALKCA|nr:tRNA preQ1(34) S-adenosylmethionine ribosyltransferase-isomerase QueA [Alkalicella caledoniensis]QNO15726.1 tRNA preQ1(34) S-adenosylmethionine ribosyltransferase-isomerase QueA [Alkalicella caledoniensis]
MEVKDYDFYLPEKLIAQKPSERRDHSRLLVLSKESGNIEHKSFYECLEFLNPNDLIIFNDTKVLPARLFGNKVSGGKVEVMLLNEVAKGTWECLAKPGKKLKEGTQILFSHGLEGIVEDDTEFGGKTIKFNMHGLDFLEAIDKIGELPLPPYIKEKPEDYGRYQTVYAQNVGAVAAPTAGLHFTEELLDKINAKGVETSFITLHVGLGTFRPVQVEKIEEHKMHSEFYSISKETVEAIKKCKERKGRVVAVGTTVVRTLETIANLNDELTPTSGWTDIFIYPGYNFKIVNGLFTNFHLPKSTLVMLVSAFAGKEKVMNAYSEAVTEEYRFFSFGDGMLIL